jgi:hypothetical protein
MSESEVDDMRPDNEVASYRRAKNQFVSLVQVLCLFFTVISVGLIAFEGRTLHHISEGNVTSKVLIAGNYTSFPSSLFSLEVQRLLKPTEEEKISWIRSWSISTVVIESLYLLSLGFGTIATIVESPSLLYLFAGIQLLFPFISLFQGSFLSYPEMIMSKPVMCNILRPIALILTSVACADLIKRVRKAEKDDQLTTRM